MSFKKLNLLSLCVFAFSAAVCGQVPRIATVYHDVHKIDSQVLNEERTVLVRVPNNYDARTNEKFPVIYMLDAHPPQNELMVGLIEQQVWGNQMPEMIVVGIQNTNRTRDMTPTETGRANSGGSGKFLEFIETEVIPLVGKKYRTRPYRIFAGHSLGGLTVVYSFVSRPDLFNAYIAASPVLHYDNNFVIREAEKLFENKKPLEKTMFLGLGDEPEYRAGWKKFQSLLKEEKPKGFEYEFREFPEENHASVVLRAYYWGLRKIFDGWEPKNIATVNELERHYEMLSKRFGYQILIPEATLNQIGYQYLRENKLTEAIGVFRKNVENYPDSANVYDSLGEALEKTGSLKQARENYEKAFQIATEQGDERLAQIFKANLERVSEKIR